MPPRTGSPNIRSTQFARELAQAATARGFSMAEALVEMASRTDDRDQQLKAMRMLAEYTIGKPRPQPAASTVTLPMWPGSSVTERIEHVQQQVAAGEMSIETGEALTKMLRDLVAVDYAARLATLVERVKAGESLEVVVADLIAQSQLSAGT